MCSLRLRWLPAALVMAALCVVGARVAVAQGDHSVHWEANWIWPATAAIAPHPNQFLLFRKTFRLTESVRYARVAVFADSRYRLYVNGLLIGQGPARNPIYWSYFDVFDVASRLHPGLNVIAVEVRWFGRELAWYEPPPHGGEHGALLCQLDLREGQKTQTVPTDATWRVAEDHAWDWNTPAINGALANVEVYHSDRVMKDWTQPEFDDRGWIPAAVVEAAAGRAGGLTSPPAEPYTHLTPRPMAYPMESEVSPAKVVSAGVIRTGASPIFSVRRPTSLDAQGERLANEDHQVQPSILRNAEALTSASPTDYAEVTPSPDGQTPYVILDMGREVDGYLHFNVESTARAAIDIGWSELMDHGNIIANEPSGNYIAQYFVTPGSQQWTMWGWHGLRYLELSFPHLSAPIRVRAGLLFSTAQVRHGGSFTCSSELLTKLWQMGVYTWQLCTLDGIMDCPTREQRQYVGDGEVELLVDYVADGTWDIARKFFLDAARDQRQDGAILAVSASNFNQIVADYPLSYINALYEYYFQTGDRDFVLGLYPSMVRALAWIQDFKQDDGLLGAMPYRVSLDWFVSFEQRGESSALNAIYARSLENAARLAELAGDHDHQQVYRDHAAAIRGNFDRRFWSDSRGVYVDGWRGEQQSERVSQIANANAILYGLAPAGAVPGIIAKITDPALVRAVVFDPVCGYVPVNGELQPSHDIVRAETYTMFFVLRALAEHGYVDTARNIIESLWGPMAAAGNDTFWERFEQRKGTACHAWSAAPTYFLTTQILGVQPTEPGYAAYRVAPQPAGLSWAQGSVPTVRGIIRVDWRWQAAPDPVRTGRDTHEAFALNLKAPFDASVDVVLPSLKGQTPSAVMVNGKPVNGPVKITKAGDYSIQARF